MRTWLHQTWADLTGILGMELESWGQRLLHHSARQARRAYLGLDE